MSTTAVIDLLNFAGVQVGGPHPFDIKVHDSRLFDRVLAEGSLGLGEAYMEGWWDCDDLSQFFFQVFRSHLDERVTSPMVLLQALKAKVLNLQSPRKSFEVGEVHYDLGNEMYAAMLDRRMIYTCGYWKEAKNLDEAQEAKLELVCKKLNLARGMRVLDIGCGWGGFLKYACEKYGVSGTGVTVSRQQADLAEENCAAYDVEIKLQDYRDLQGSYDRVVSLGMFEHVGYKNYQTYMGTVSRCLSEDGLFLLHCIGGNKSETSTDPWIDKYIFPHGMIPSIAQIGKSIEGLFVMEDWHNFGPYYDKTLMSWFENFDRYWREQNRDFDSSFYRRWKYYLLSCAGAFRARKLQLWQVVLSKYGTVGGYQSLR